MAVFIGKRDIWKGYPRLVRGSRLMYPDERITKAWDFAIQQGSEPLRRSTTSGPAACRPVALALKYFKQVHANSKFETNDGQRN